MRGGDHAVFWQTAGGSIQPTFISTVILLILSILPSYLISKYIARQVE